MFSSRVYKTKLQFGHTHFFVYSFVQLICAYLCIHVFFTPCLSTNQTLALTAITLCYVGGEGVGVDNNQVNLLSKKDYMISVL